MTIEMSTPGWGRPSGPAFWREWGREIGHSKPHGFSRDFFSCLKTDIFLLNKISNDRASPKCYKCPKKHIDPTIWFHSIKLKLFQNKAREELVSWILKSFSWLNEIKLWTQCVFLTFGRRSEQWCRYDGRYMLADWIFPLVGFYENNYIDIPNNLYF